MGILGVCYHKVNSLVGGLRRRVAQNSARRRRSVFFVPYTLIIASTWIHFQGKRGQNRGKIGTYLFGACLCRAKIFQSQELRGRRASTRESDDLAGVAEVRAERSPVRAWGGDTAETYVSGDGTGATARGK